MYFFNFLSGQFISCSIALNGSIHVRFVWFFVYFLVKILSRQKIAKIASMCTVQGGTLERVHQHDCDNKKFVTITFCNLTKKITKRFTILKTVWINFWIWPDKKMEKMHKCALCREELLKEFINMIVTTKEFFVPGVPLFNCYDQSSLPDSSQRDIRAMVEVMGFQA